MSIRTLLLSLLSAFFIIAGTSAQEPATGGDYTIGPQDVLKVLVFDEPQLSGTFRVDGDGSFQYPLVGRIKAGGMTSRELEASLVKQLENGYVRRAQVAIQIEQYRSRSIFVMGEVRTPGKYPLTGQMTMIEALAAAGSVTAGAGGEVLILKAAAAGAADRPASPDSTTSSNVQRISLTDLQQGNLTLNVTLAEGDTVFVPKAQRFFVTGHVKSPGVFTFEQDLTVLQALSLAGGITEKGSNRRLKVVRIVGGKKVERGISLNEVIQPNDTIVVAQRLL